MQIAAIDVNGVHHRGDRGGAEVGVGGDLQRAAIEEGFAGVGVEAGENQGAGTRFDQRIPAIIRDDGADRHRRAAILMDDEVRRPAGTQRAVEDGFGTREDRGADHDAAAGHHETIGGIK